MSSSNLYCATCGAANAHAALACFACGKSMAATPEEDEGITPLFQQTLLNNRYRLLTLVGQGGFAKVYKAEDTYDAKVVVVKIISLQALTPQEIIDATDTFNREIHFGATLRHSSLPQIYDSFTDRDHWYIVAEFIEGQTLEEYMLHQPTKRLPLQEVLSIGIQICTVLAYLHAQHPPIVFRDMKPENIMRTAKGHVYLIDFGIARRQRPGRDTQPLGSPGYAAPEQYGATAQTTERSDIYSLGATLRALLTGKNPLDVPTTSVEDELAEGLLAPPAFTELLACMLERNPANRYENIGAVKQQLEYIVKYSDFAPRETKHPVTPSNQFQPVAPSPVLPTAKGGVLRTTFRYHTWQKVLITTLTLLVIWGGIGSGAFSAVGTFLQQKLQPQGITSYPPVSPGKASADRQVLTFALNNVGIETLDPAAVIDTTSMQATEMLYTGLVGLDDNMNVRPQLASSWQQSADGLTWTFVLRPNLRFSDGTPLTTSDVAYSLDRALDPTVNSPTASSYLQYIMDADKRMTGSVPTLIGDSILVVDPSTIVLRTSRRIGFFLDALTTSCALVIEKSLVSKYGQHFVDHLNEGGSSGPFKLDHRAANGSVDLVANVDYYGAAPQIKKVSFVVYESDSTAYKAYLLNQISLTNVPQENIEEARLRSDFHQMPQLWIDYYAMNYLVKPFDNVKIRQAFALALNKEQIAHSVWHDAVLATNHIIPQGQAGYNATLMGPDGDGTLSGDPQSAQQLLQQGMLEEGIGSIREFPPVTFTYADDSATIENEVKTAQQMWQSVLGVKVNLQRVSISKLYDQEMVGMNSPHGLQFWRMGYSADYPDPQDWTSLHFGQGSSLNSINYGQNGSADAAKQQQVQQLLQIADAMPQQDERMQAYHHVEQALVNDVAWLPMYQVQANYLLKSNIKGYRMNAMNVIPADDWANIYVM